MKNLKKKQILILIDNNFRKRNSHGYVSLMVDFVGLYDNRPTFIMLNHLLSALKNKKKGTAIHRYKTHVTGYRMLH